MKTRLGFVSNSSSSSYLIITSKECHDKVLSAMTERERLALEIFGCIENSGSTLFGVPIVTLSYMDGNNGDYLYDNIRGDERYEEFCSTSEENDDGMDEIWEAVSSYKTAVRKDKENTFSHSEDC